MKNADIPAMPTPIMDNCCTPHGTKPTYGLTKREMFAMHIMANIIHNGAHTEQGNEKYYAERAVSLADALLEELSK